MNLRAEQWMMVGVVALGATAVYLLTRARPRSGDDRPVMAPSLTPGTPGTLPLAQNIVRDGASPGAPKHALLRRGTNVLGRLELGNVSDAAALQNLQRAGFTNVQLYTLADTRANPGIVTLPDALVNPGSGSRWFWATWNGNSGDVPLPSEVVLLWYTTTSNPRSGGVPYAHAYGWSY